MNINIERNGNESTVFVQGDIDLHSSPDLREAVLDLFRKRNQKKVVVNLKGVDYIDSSGIASLVEGLQESRKLDARFILAGLNESPRHVLELTRLLNVFEIEEEPEETGGEQAAPAAEN